MKILEKFKIWNQLKQSLDLTKKGKKDSKFFYEKDVWFTHLGKNVGDEQDGTGKSFLRPVLIFKKFNKNLFWAIPATSRKKRGAFYFPISKIKEKENTLILSQIRLLDSRRLKYKIGRIKNDKYEEVKKKLTELINEFPLTPK